MSLGENVTYVLEHSEPVDTNPPNECGDFRLALFTPFSFFPADKEGKQAQ
jgi:hypothetical protein